MLMRLMPVDCVIIILLFGLAHTRQLHLLIAPMGIPELTHFERRPLESPLQGRTAVLLQIMQSGSGSKSWSWRNQAPGGDGRSC